MSFLRVSLSGLLIRKRWIYIKVHSVFIDRLVVSELCSETKGSRFESGHQLRAEYKDSLPFPCRPAIRSSHQRCSIKIGVLKNFAKYTGKHLCQCLFLNKVADLFFCEFCKIFKNTFFTEHLYTTAS